MLLEFKRSSIPYMEVPIKTVYIEENASTHFNPVKDSIKIYKVIFRYTFSATALKYVLSSLASWVIDNLIFNLLDIFLVNEFYFSNVQLDFDDVIHQVEYQWNLIVLKILMSLL